MTNWPTKKLGDCLIQFDRGISWSRKDEGGTIAVLRIPNIQEGHINLDDLKYINAKVGNGELQKNDIVMVASNGNPDLVGRSALVTEKEKGMRFASFLIRLRLDNAKLLSHYAHLFLLTPTFKRGLRRKIATTSGIYNLKKEHIEKIKIPLPPLEIQKQIVGRLDKIVEAQKLNDELIQKADELFQSLLHKELNPAGKDWKTKKLSEVGEIVTGTTPSTKNSEYWNGEFLWATPTDIKENTFILMDTPKKLSRAGYEKTRPVPQNAILVTCIASIGKMVLAGKEMATNQQINSIVCNKENDPLFVFFSLQKDKKKLINLGKTTAVPIINKSEFGRIKISLPPLETQKQIVAKLSAVQNYKTQLLAQKSKLKELFNSALSKALAGELVKEDAVAVPAKVSIFPVWQAIGAVLQRLERGEMVVAKLLYLSQEIYKVPLGFSFTSQNFGPYDLQIKRAITAGASSRNSFFKQKNGIYGLGANSGKLFKYNSKILNSMKFVLNDLMPAIKSSTSAQIECLATVCKVMQDTKINDLAAIDEKVQAWKPNKFQRHEIKGALDFIKSKGWNKKLINV